MENLENEIEIFNTAKDKHRKTVYTIISMVVVVVLALVTALLLKTYVICTITVGGDSMLPTLVGGEYILDEKIKRNSKIKVLFKDGGYFVE